LFDQTVDGREYRCGAIPLLDAAGRDVGKLIVLDDIGDQKAFLRLLLVAILGLNAAVILLLIALFRRLIRSIERRLTALYADLRVEIRRREATEAELREHRDHLDELVCKRTAELETTNEQLSQEIADRLAAENQLGELNKELQDTVRKLDLANNDLRVFLHAAAHDLKAPVRAIGTLADWIRDDCGAVLCEQSQVHLDTLVQRAQWLDRHLRRIVEFSEISSAGRPARDVDLDALVHDVMTEIDPPRGIDLVVANPLPIVKADRTHMSQIFENLLSNAVRYMGKPQGAVTVRCVRDGDFWRFSVSDTGPGIEGRYLSRIFEAFQTLLPRDQMEATGMGLAIAKRGVESYGGTIWAESVVGRGSTFFFTLPARIVKDVGRSVVVSNNN
jgi:signal transduction histidine kinase